MLVMADDAREVGEDDNNDVQGHGCAQTRNIICATLVLPVFVCFGAEWVLQNIFEK